MHFITSYSFLYIYIYKYISYTYIFGEYEKLGLVEVRFDSGQARPPEGTKKDDTVVHYDDIL